MKSTRGLGLLVVLAIVPSTACAQQDHARNEPHGAMLGRVSFENSGSQQAQKPFLVGLALVRATARYPL